MFENPAIIAAAAVIFVGALILVFKKVAAKTANHWDDEVAAWLDNPENRAKVEAFVRDLIAKAAAKA